MSGVSVAALGAINTHAVELLGPIEQIRLPDCPIVCRRRRAAHAIDRIASHFPSALFLAIPISARVALFSVFASVHAG